MENDSFWSGPGGPVSSADSLVAPALPGGAKEELHPSADTPASEAALAGLVSTLPPDLTATPVTGTQGPWSKTGERESPPGYPLSRSEQGQHLRMGIALGLAVGIVGTLLVLAGLLSGLWLSW